MCGRPRGGCPSASGWMRSPATWEEVFQRVTLLLPTVILLWLFGISRAVDRSFSALMPTRGGVDLPSVACVLNSAAHAAAVRAGSRAWSAQA